MKKNVVCYQFWMDYTLPVFILLHVCVFMEIFDTKKNIIVYINNLPRSGVTAVKKLEQIRNEKLFIMLLRDSRRRKTVNDEAADYTLDIDFSNQSQIARSLLPYFNRLLAITCRSESNIARFISVIPHVPYLATTSTQSLEWASDKYEMRKRFKIFDSEHTPRFTLVKSYAKTERERVIKKVGFPMIIKPTNLAGSALVSVCYHEEELEKTLRRSFRRLRSIYSRDSRIEIPRLMAEEYIEGTMYSIDSYVDNQGNVTHCPIVRVKTGKDVGHDDFYNYLRITPTKLKPSSVQLAQERAEIGIKALGLRNITTHTELFHIDGDWKIIEIGPRIGGHRHELHRLSCDINHSLNDILTRIPGKKPDIPKKCKGYAAVMRYYASKEGIVEQLNGIRKIQDLKSFKNIDVKVKVGDRVYFAKHGGAGVFDLTLYNDEYSKLLADIRHVEQMVNIGIKNRRKKVNQSVIGAKKVAKSTVSKKLSATTETSAQSVAKSPEKKATTKVIKKTSKKTTS